MRPTRVLVTVTGQDRPGVTAVTFAALAAHDVDVRDVAQFVKRGRGTLEVLIDLRGDVAALRHSVRSTAQAFGVDAKAEVIEDGEAATLATRPPRTASGSSHTVVVARQLRAGAIGDVANRIADAEGNIEAMWQSSDEHFIGVEMMLDGEPARLRSALFHAADEVGVDVGVGPAGSTSHATRLLVLDANATLPGETGSRAWSPRVTDFTRAARRSGCRLAAVSAGDAVPETRLTTWLDLDAVVPTAEDEPAATLQRLAGDLDVPVADVVVVGDGRRSSRLLHAAATAIAVDGGSAQRAAADPKGQSPYLDSVLYLLKRV